MKTGFELTAEPRAGSGRADSRRLRRQGLVPAVMYGGGQAPSALVLDQNALARHMDREAFYTSILTVKIGAETQPVVVKDVQRHPVRPQVMHLDFQRIVEDEEISLYVPIHFIGEAMAKGVKEQGGVVEHLLTEAEVTCLPRYLPEYLEIDVSAMELNQILHLSDIVLPEGVSLVALRHNQDQPLVAINPPRREEEEVPPEGAEVPAGEVPSVQTETDEESSE